jgi:threonine/homoserine/homoserine lactone efflux protein
MGRLLKVFLIGMLISALGTLPLGTLNILSMQLSVAEGYVQALYFAAGVTLVEMAYVRVSLVGMDWVRKRKKLFKWLDWITVAIVVALAVANFIAAGQPHASRNAIINNHINRFLFGLMMSAINPVQIPFWFGWSTVLFSKKVLESNNRFYYAYIASLIGLALFIFGGQLFAKTLEQNTSIVSLVIGGVFTVTAIIQVIRIIKHKGIADSLEKKQN